MADLNKIKQDHRRFKQIVRGKIKENLRKYMSQGELTGKQGKDTVKVPIPRIDIPAFASGRKTPAVSARAKAKRATSSVRAKKVRARAVKPEVKRVITPSTWM